MKRSKWATKVVALAAVGVLAMVAVACGGDDSGDADTTNGIEAPAGTGVPEGSGALDGTDAPEATDSPDGTDGGVDQLPTAEFEEVEPDSGDGLKIGYISIGEAIPFA